MPVLPDNQFENYLRQFHPLPPEGMPEKYGPTRWHRAVISPLAAVAAVLIIVFALVLLSPSVRPSPEPAAQLPHPGIAPLTIQSANSLLSRSPSLQAAVDAMAVPSHSTLPKNKQSAFNVLSKDSKLWTPFVQSRY